MENLQYLLCCILSVIAFIGPVKAEDYRTDYANGISWIHTGGSFGRRVWDFGWYYYPSISTTTTGPINLPSVLGGSTMTTIFPNAFQECASITEVSMPDTITTIGRHAFYQSGIESIAIPDSVRTIGEYAFGGCRRLNSVVLPSRLDNIAEGVFQGCSDLQIIDLPSTVTNIGINAIGGTGIHGISIPSQVESIGQYAFLYCTNLNELLIPRSVKNIGHLAFRGCSKLKSVEFEGDAPKMVGGGSLFEVGNSVNSNCCSYVRKDSSGWNVEIPGFWSGARIDYAKYKVTFEANGGAGNMEEQPIFIGKATHLLPCSFSWNDYVFAGWSADANGSVIFADEALVRDLAGLNENVTLYAQWAVAAPVIEPAENTMFHNASQEISMSCDTDGASILFTLDGTDPSQCGRMYTKPFSVYKSCTIRAVAVKTGLLASEETYITLTRAESLSEAANLYGYTVETGSAASWTVDTTVSHDGVSSIRSNGDGSYVQTSVRGAGKLSFWWRAQCEEPDDGEYYDYGALKVGSAYSAYIAGNDTGWTFFSTNIATTGKHTLRWEYHKDDEGSYQPDCVWLDQVQWIPVDGSGYTLTTPEPVPYSWLMEYNLGVVEGDFEAAANAANGKTSWGRPMSVWQDYVAGTDPTNAASRLTAKIEMQGATPRVTWEPNLNEDGVARRVYKVHGSETLEHGGNWQYPTNSLHRFFRVTVEMP